MSLSEAGEQMRARAEQLVYHRYKVLLDRSKRRALTAVERRELDEAERALGELHSLERHPRGDRAPTL